MRYLFLCCLAVHVIARRDVVHEKSIAVEKVDANKLLNNVLRDIPMWDVDKMDAGLQLAKTWLLDKVQSRRPDLVSAITALDIESTANGDGVSIVLHNLDKDQLGDDKPMNRLMIVKLFALLRNKIEHVKELSTRAILDFTIPLDVVPLPLLK